MNQMIIALNQHLSREGEIWVSPGGSRPALDQRQQYEAIAVREARGQRAVPLSLLFANRSVSSGNHQLYQLDPINFTF